jgi:YCII-related domain
VAKFILLYNGPATPMEEMTSEQGQAVMEKWQAWMGRVGDALIDVGAPMANGEAIVDDGSSGTATQLNGYTIVEADDANAVKALLDDHPFLSDRSGKFSVEIHELLPVPV